LGEHETAITEEMLAAQGSPVDIGGYYHPDPALCEKAMRPSSTFNEIIK
jgi:isocitrate dehydrogenase